MFFAQRGLQDSAQGFNPISANLMKPFDGRVAFVPEGQADRSQARSAWAAIQRAPSRRDGRSYGQSHAQSQRAEIRSIVPLGRGHFPPGSRHFVPGLKFGSIY